MKGIVSEKKGHLLAGVVKSGTHVRKGVRSQGVNMRAVPEGASHIHQFSPSKKTKNHKSLMRPVCSLDAVLGRVGFHEGSCMVKSYFITPDQLAELERESAKSGMCVEAYVTAGVLEAIYRARTHSDRERVRLALERQALKDKNDSESDARADHIARCMREERRRGRRVTSKTWREASASASPKMLAGGSL